MPGIAGMQSRLATTWLSRHNAILSIPISLPPHSFKTIPQDNDWPSDSINSVAPAVLSKMKHRLPRACVALLPTLMQSKKYTVIEAKLGTFVTRDSFWGRNFHESLFQRSFLSQRAQLFHLNNFALARFSHIFHFAQTNVQFDAKKRVQRKKKYRTRSRVQESGRDILFCVICFFILYLFRLLITST